MRLKRRFLSNLLSAGLALASGATGVQAQETARDLAQAKPKQAAQKPQPAKPQPKEAAPEAGADGSSEARDFGHVGILLGAAFPFDEDLSTRFSFGGRFMYELSQRVGLGAYVTTSSEEVTGGSVRTSFYGVEADYSFSDSWDEGGPFGGVRVGLATVSAGPLAVDPFSFGFVAGYDTAEMKSGIIFGIEASLMFALDRSESLGGATASTDSFEYLNLLGAVKYRF